MSPTEKRRFKRLESSLTIRFSQTASPDTTGNPKQTGRVVNISKSGLLLHQKSNIPPGAELEIMMTISRADIRLTGICIYCASIDTGIYEAGIQITAIALQEEDNFFAYITELEKNDLIFQSLRPKIGGITDVIKRITAEHKIINRYVIVMKKILGTDLPDFEHLGTLLTLMKKDLIPHFRIEDKLVFKVAGKYLGSTTTSVMATLSEEHKDIIEELNTLTAKIQSDLLQDEPIPAVTRDSLTDFLKRLIKHATFELAELFPIIEDNLEAKEMIMKKILELSSRDIKKELP